MKVLAFLAFLSGLGVIPSLLLTPEKSAIGETPEGVSSWWQFLLVAVGMCVAGWLLGFVLPLPAYGFATGYMLGNVAGLVIAWFVPETPALYFFATVLSLFVSGLMCEIASQRSDQADLRRLFR